MGTFKHVIGSLGDIGVEVLKETAKVPVKLVEGVVPPVGENKKQLGALGDVDASKNTEENRQKARRVLQQFVGSSEPARKEPTVYEKKIMEEKQEKEMLSQQKKLEEQQTIRPISTKPKRGQLYGIREKTTEASKNVKAE